LVVPVVFAARRATVDWLARRAERTTQALAHRVCPLRNDVCFKLLEDAMFASQAHVLGYRHREGKHERIIGLELTSVT
jgi:hypothetical protein